MDEKSRKNMLESLVLFRDEINREMEENVEDYVRIWEEYPIEHLEDALRDKVIIYMGDKESERAGTEKDAIEIGALCYLLWLRKRNQHLI
ncbi:MAG: hypothetical protein R6V01_08585 [Thermoplasmatota archaeon]